MTKLMSERPLRTVVVDDELPARRLLNLYVDRHARLTGVGEGSDGATAIEAVSRLAPDLLILDVEMPGLDGFGVLANLAKCGKTPAQVIFATAFDHYAVRAFEVNAVDYLLKPISQERFDKAVDRCVGQREGWAGRLGGLLEDMLHLPPQRLLLRHRRQIVPVPVAEMDWLEAEGDYVRIHTGTRNYLIEKTLTELERALAPQRFARVHRSAVVNLARISELRPLGSARYEVQMMGGALVVASRTYSAALKQALSAGNPPRSPPVDHS